MMKLYFWIIRLRLFRLFSLLRYQLRQEIAVVSYLDSTRTAKIVLKLLKKLDVLKFTLKKIESRDTASGPHLDMSSVRNDKGKVITIDIIHHVLHLRRQILESLKESIKDFPFLRNKISLNMQSAYFGAKIAQEITPIVYIADYARWQGYEKGGKNRKNILVIPRSDWSSVLAENLKQQMDQVIIDKRKGKKEIKRLVVILRNVIVSLLKTGFNGFFSKFAAADIDTEELRWNYHKDGKVMTIYSMGVFSDKRNDLSFFHAANMKPARLALLFRYIPLKPSIEELKWLEDNRVVCCATPRMPASIPGIPQWQASSNLKKLLKEFCMKYLNAFFQCLSARKKWSLWFLDKYWEMGFESAYWKDMFIANKISIIVHQIPAVENFIPSCAISELGGISVNLERSMLLDYCSYLHNPPNHVYLVTGSYSLTQIPEPSFSLCTIQVGGLNIKTNVVPIPGFDELKRQSKIILSIFDEIPSDWFFGDSIRQLYQAMIDLVDQDQRFGLLIKSKKPQVFEKMKDVYKEIQRLTAQGKCLELDWKVTVSSVAASSDMSVCVPSTAVFESVLTGTRTIIFNPMRSSSGIFYRNNGLNRRIFHDSKSMLAALKRYTDGKDLSVGDCSELVPFVDPYYDGKGAERIGKYLLWCQEGFDLGKERSQVIISANRRYIQKWGRDKVTNENAYEKLPDFCSFNPGLKKTV